MHCPVCGSSFFKRVEVKIGPATNDYKRVSECQKCGYQTK